jgi:hypothetical protein
LYQAATQPGRRKSLAIRWNVWARFYVRSFGKSQRDEARTRMLAHGFGALPEPENVSQMSADLP